MKLRLLCGIMMLSVAFNSLSGNTSNNEMPLRDFQLSILPFIGTEGREVVQHRYRFSINLLAGTTGGIQGVEAGGILNLNRTDVTGIQLAGFGNLAGGSIQGLQAAGFANVSGGHRQGFAWAGFANVSGGHRQGFAWAGFANVSGGSHQGFTWAGFANINGGGHQGFAWAGFANVSGGNNEGAILAGFANAIGGHHRGLALAGFANKTGNGSRGFLGAGFGNISRGEILGVQLGGFGNVSKGDTQGAQLAGFLNISRNIRGIQVSGFINVANTVEGLQLGFINVADTISRGVPIGFLNLIGRGGIRQFELSASDVVHLSAAFRTGAHGFYNIFSYGTRPFTGVQFSGLGYGVGTGVNVREHMGLQLELHSTPLHHQWRWWGENPDILNEIRLHVGFRSDTSLELFAGPVVYNQVSREDPDTGTAGKNIAHGWIFHEDQWGDYAVRWWMGARGGLRVNLR